jgi:hypothetical protein
MADPNLKSLLDALLKVTEAASMAATELPSGLTGVIYDLGVALATDLRAGKSITEILSDLDAVFAKEPAADQVPAIQTALNDVAKALATAKSAISAAETVAAVAAPILPNSVETAVQSTETEVEKVVG